VHLHSYFKKKYKYNLHHSIYERDGREVVSMNMVRRIRGVMGELGKGGGDKRVLEEMSVPVIRDYCLKTPNGVRETVGIC
jgi:hypothetical protein